MTAYHMLVATIGTRILQRLPFERLRAKRIHMDVSPHTCYDRPQLNLQWNLWSKTILPLSLLFSASLILSNMAYVYLSVSFVQMLKVCSPSGLILIPRLSSPSLPSSFSLSLVYKVRLSFCAESSADSQSTTISYSL